MFLNFKVTSKPGTTGYYQPSPNLRQRGRNGFYGVLSLVFSLLVGFGSQAQAANPYGLVKWSANKYKVGEQEGSVFLQVKRTDGGVGGLTVKYGTQSHTAKPGTDYEATEGTLTWVNNDQSTKLIEITIHDDNEHEETEQFNVVLLDAMGHPNSADLQQKSAKVEITDDDEERNVSPIPEATKKVAIFKTLLPIPKPMCLSCPILFKFKFRILGGPVVVTSTRSLAEGRAEERSAPFTNFDPASQAFLVGLQNGLAPFGLNEVEVEVTETGTYFKIPIYYDEGGMVDGWYQAIMGEPTPATEAQEGMFITPDGLAQLFYSDGENNYWKAILYPMLTTEIVSAVEDAFPGAQLAQEEGVVSLAVDGNTYYFNPSYFVKVSGWDTAPLDVTYVYDEEGETVKYMVVSGQGREQLIDAAN